MDSAKSIETQSTDVKPEAVRRRLGGFLVRKPCWTISLWGKLVIVTVLVVFTLLMRWKLCSFLSPTEPVSAQYLVVEGWAPTYVIEQAMAEFRRGGYKKILT